MPAHSVRADCAKVRAMIRPRSVLATAALTLALLSGTTVQVRDDQGGAAQAGGTFAGRVEVEDAGARSPVRRAQVMLIDEAGRPTLSTASDADGRYRFESVIVGEYRVLARKPGFVAAPVRVERQAAGALTVDLLMQRAGALEGRFIDHRGDPIARINVTADRWPQRPGDHTTASAHSATTDDLGRFRIHTLPPGNYRVHAMPPPPASGERFFYPGTTNPEDARIVAVATGQTLGGLDVTVPAGSLSPLAAEVLAAAERDAANAPAAPGYTARIAGRVTRNDNGQPIANAAVEIASTPGAALSIRRLARTDSNGRFEFARLGSGEFLLTATAHGFLSADGSLIRPGGGETRVVVKNGERFEGADVALAPTSAIEGRVLDESGDPVPDVVVQIAQRFYRAGLPRFASGPPSAIGSTGPTDDRGWFRAFGIFPGDYYLFAIPEPFERSSPAGFATTFFPGTAAADGAVPVQVVAGRDVLDVRFSLVAARTGAISGVALDTAGRPVPRSQIMLLPTYDGEIRAQVMARTTAGADGTFHYRDVPEGAYVLQAAGGGMFGSLHATVTALPDQESRPVALTLSPFTTARGRVVFEGAAQPPRDPKSVTIRFESTDLTNGPIGSSPSASRISAGWDFEIPNLASHGVLRAIAPAGWALARVRLHGRDITETPYDFQSADVSGLEVVLTSRLGAVSVTVVSGGRRVPDAGVMVLGADSTASHLSGVLAAGRTTADGTVAIGGLPEGRYLAVAFSPGNRPVDPHAILALRPIATPFVVIEGATAALTLTTVR